MASLDSMLGEALRNDIAALKRMQQSAKSAVKKKTGLETALSEGGEEADVAGGEAQG